MAKIINCDICGMIINPQYVTEVNESVVYKDVYIKINVKVGKNTLGGTNSDVCLSCLKGGLVKWVDENRLRFGGVNAQDGSTTAVPESD